MKTWQITKTRTFASATALLAVLVTAVLTSAPCHAGYAEDGTKKGVKEGVGGTKKGYGYVEGGTKKGIKEGVGGSKKGYGYVEGGTKKGIKEGVGGTKKGLRETKKFINKVF